MEFSKEEYLKDVKVILATYGANLWRVMPVDFSHHFDNVRLDIACGSGPESEAEMAKLDGFFNTDFFAWFDYCYEYGMNGINFSEQDPDIIEEEDYMPFLKGLIEAYDFLGNNIEGRNQIRFDRIQHVQEKKHARVVLENFSISALPGKIYLKELATLADLDEKTIRNIASKKPEGFPIIHKSGTRSLVDKEEAREWLIKRGWKPTVTVSNTVGMYPPNSGFDSVNELRTFLEKVLEKTSIAAEKQETIKQWVNAFEVSLQIDLDVIKWVSQAGQYHPETLLKPVLDLKQKLELEQLKHQLLQP